MKIKFCIKTKNNEILNYCYSDNLDNAITYFSIIKKLPIKDLLDIFIIQELNHPSI